MAAALMAAALRQFWGTRAIKVVVMNWNR